MSDRELLELAAKAAGMTPHISQGACDGLLMQDQTYWSPLTDDGDALRLVVKLGLIIDVRYINSVMTEFNAVRYWPVRGTGDPYRSIYFGVCTDPYAATRRAVVHAAAEIGKAAP